MSDTSVKVAEGESVTQQYNTAKLTQPSPVMAALEHRDTAREQDVNTRQLAYTLCLL